MKLLKEFGREKFQSRFLSEKHCYSFLVDLKWELGYECSHCGAIVYIKGKQYHNDRYRKCDFNKLSARGTLFLKLTFGTLKVFEMVYEISTSKKGRSSIRLAEHFESNQKIAWLFRQKVKCTVEGSHNYPLDRGVTYR